MNYDVSALCGHWPFRYLRGSAAADRLRAYERLGFYGGCMASLDAVFYNDPWEADSRLLRELEGSGWRLAMCVDPGLPWMEEAVRHARSLGAAHIRLYPGIHRYCAGEAEPVLRLAAELGMTVTVTARLEDARLTHLLEQQEVSGEAFAALVGAYPGTKVLLSGFYLGELTQLGAVPDNLWADTAGLCHGLEPVEELLAAGFPLERLTFGSLSPLQCVQSYLLNLPEEHRDRLLRENPRKFLEVE